MAAILIYGPSGQGKSSALENLPFERTGIICSDQKPLPFSGWKSKYKTVRMETGQIDLIKSNYVQTNKAANVLKILEKWSQRPDLDFIVLDTLTHVIVKEFMDKALVKGYDKYLELAKAIYDILNACVSVEKNVIVIGHNDISYDTEGNKVNKVRTIGKMLDEKVDIPSMFTYVLIPEVIRNDDGVFYNFITQSDGSNSAKSPRNSLPFKIENDFFKIFNLIDKYENDSD
jgi:hypothetical protein